MWVTPAFADAVQLSNAGEADFVTALLTYTPLHLAWLAREAVIVFFVLSGFVLARPFLSRRRSYIPYYPSRILRLAVPAWAALAVASIIAILAYPSAGSPHSELLASQIAPHVAWEDFAGAWLVGGAPQVLLPLWSLKWEIAFSLLLPLYVFVARWAVGAWKGGAVAVACVGISAAGTYLEVDELAYLPTFMLGCLLASNQAAITTHIRGTRAAWFGALSLLALAAGWYPRGFSTSTLLTGAGQVLSLVGAAGVVIAAITWRGFAATLSRPRAMGWLGQRSFSLYLVHFPVIMAAAFLTMGENLAVTLAVGVPASLLLAEVFYLLVEKPSMNLAHAVKRRLTPDGAVKAETSTAPRHS